MKMGDPNEAKRNTGPFCSICGEYGETCGCKGDRRLVSEGEMSEMRRQGAFKKKAATTAPKHVHMKMQAKRRPRK